MQKRILIIFTTCVLSFTFLWTGCKAPQQGHAHFLDEVNDLVAAYNSEINTFYTREGQFQNMINLFQGSKITDSLYEFNLGEGILKKVKIKFTDNPYIYTLHQNNHPEYQTAYALHLRIFKEAKSTQSHSGFQSRCITTYGHHREHGASMKWKVDNWKSCQRGSDYCVETWQAIGKITYYFNKECNDSIIKELAIMRYVSK